MCGANIIALISAIIMKSAGSTIVTTILIAINLIVAAKYLCVAIQRFHDIDRSGSSYWLLYIPIYNIYLEIILLFKKGVNGSNEYGDNPLHHDEEVAHAN
jgi:uncharacterized membrane protein YhaH (DUF805 family)